LQGALVDVYAPGTNIYSVAIDNDQVRKEGGREGEVEEEERRRRRRRRRRSRMRSGHHRSIPPSLIHLFQLIPRENSTLSPSEAASTFSPHLTVPPSLLPPSLQAYGYRTGTSQAAPFVTGAIACILGDALAVGGPVACRSSSTLLQSFLNPNVRVQQMAKGAKSLSDARRPLLYVPPGAKYTLDCPLPSGLMEIMAAAAAGKE